jgi:putative acetyltransferase
LSKPAIQLRPEEPDDVAAIATVIETAFEIAAEAQLVAALREAEALTVSLVALAGGRIVGHVALSPVAVGGATSGNRWLGLAPLAVLPEWRRRGIGGELVHAALAIAAARQSTLVFVLGRPSYYERLGFEVAASHGWRCVYDAPEPAFRVHRLGEGHRLPPPGTVTYHAAFDAL